MLLTIDPEDADDLGDGSEQHQERAPVVVHQLQDVLPALKNTDNNYLERKVISLTGNTKTHDNNKLAGFNAAFLVALAMLCHVIIFYHIKLDFCF